MRSVSVLGLEMSTCLRWDLPENSFILFISNVIAKFVISGANRTKNKGFASPSWQKWKT